MAAPIKLFYSYAHEDERWRDELEKHLSTLKQQERITGWHDRQIAGGKAWAHEIASNLQDAHIILLLISPDFMASTYCSTTEIPLAMERYEAGTARVIPIILRPVDHQGAPFDKLQALPTDAKPITTSSNIDQAFHTVAQGIRTVVEELTAHPLPSPSPSSAIGNLPRRNPYFTGREEILSALHTMLIANTTATLTQPPAISGLGGIGKTQTATEYAYRYRRDYHHLLWVKADTQETLTSDFVAIAKLLNLPEKDAQDQTLIVKAVKGWLEANANWLLIFDNADDLHLVHDFLPAGEQGHLLLTTRAHSMGGIARRVEIEKMDQEQGALFLLRRAGIIQPDAPLSSAPEADRIKAKDISQAMDGLPLALDQAGAFIDETACSLADYLAIYRQQRAELHTQRGGIASPHPEPVAATWSLSFQKVKKANPAAAELLRLCAFLHPDAIPEELITEGASKLGPVLQPVAGDPIKLNKAIGELLTYSLVRRDPKTNTLSIHRLVQAVLKDGMGKDEQRQWAERTVLAVNLTFPSPLDFAMWNLCERCLPHAQTCAELIDQWDITFGEAARLLNDTGLYLNERARYAEAEPLYQRALAIDEMVLGAGHPDVATDLNNLATLYTNQGKYAEAEPLYQRALAIGEKTLEPEHPNVAIRLNNLANLYSDQGKYAEAEPLYQRALAIGEKTLGPEHPNVAIRLNNLALLYADQGKYAEAELLYQRALAIGEKVLGPEHPNVAAYLNSLAALYTNQGKYAEAEPLYQRALAISEKTLGADHSAIATYLNNLANLYWNQGKYAEAEPLYQQALKILEKALGANHPSVALGLENYASLLRVTNRGSEAAELEARAKAIRAKHAQENPVDRGV
jgi:tetratricopeptide (TPR) repeat protein